MPKIEGSRLAEKMLHIRPGFPIILCTGYSTSISEEEAVAMGIKAFVMKPVNIRKLTGIIRRILDANKVGSN
jgi:DNA-binding NtrC family response regulator